MSAPRLDQKQGADGLMLEGSQCDGHGRKDVLSIRNDTEIVRRRRVRPQSVASNTFVCDDGRFFLSCVLQSLISRKSELGLYCGPL